MRLKPVIVAIDGGMDMAINDKNLNNEIETIKSSFPVVALSNDQ